MVITLGRAGTYTGEKMSNHVNRESYETDS